MYKQSSMGAVLRAGGGALAGGLIGHEYGDAKSDGSTSGRLAGTLAGAIGGGLTGLGMHGARKFIGKGHIPGLMDINRGGSAANALTGIGGLTAAAGVGLGSAAAARGMSPDTFRPDYVTNEERRVNTDIQFLVQKYKDAGANFSRMNPQEAQRLRDLIGDARTRSRVINSMDRTNILRQKTSAYYQPTEMDLTAAAYHMQLRRAMALRQLMAMQQMQQRQQQQPTEQQARSMINQYMGAAGVDTKSDKAQAAADKYDSKPEQPKSEPKPKAKSKPKQKPVQIKPKGGSKKTASMSLSDVQTMEKVAGEAYPTHYHQDGSVTKDINGVAHTFSPSGILKTANVFRRAVDAYKGLGTLGRAGVIGGGALAAGGAAYGGKALYDYYYNRDPRSVPEKLFDAGKAMLPDAINAYRAYNSMQNQLAAQAAGGNLVSAAQPTNPAISGLGLDGQPVGKKYLEAQRQQLGMQVPYRNMGSQYAQQQGFQQIY